MEIQLFNGEKEELTNLLCSNDWRYHSNPHLENGAIQNAVENGYYANGRETFWIILDTKKLE